MSAPTMRAMVLLEIGRPLVAANVSRPMPGPGAIRVAVEACAVCRTDLHLVDGELEDSRLPRIPGHQVVGRVDALGADVRRFAIGDRVGIPWLHSACGACAYCLEDRENLCDAAVFTGHGCDGGFAEACLADARFAIALPEAGDPIAEAPLLCAGLIGFRALRMAGSAHRIGLFGFGAAAHLLAQVLAQDGRPFVAFTRPGDDEGQAFARSLGAEQALGSDETPRVALDAALIFAPSGALVPRALAAVRKGGVVVCAGIHMSDIPAFPYRLLWGERVVRSVANLTRADGEAYFARLADRPIEARTRRYPLERANEALEDLRRGRLKGSAVLVP